MNLIRKPNYSYPSTSILEDFFGKDWSDMFGGRVSNATMPAVNVKDTPEHVELQLAAPGLKREDFKIEVENNLLSISSEKKHEEESKDGEFTRKEFSYSSFRRSFTLPDWANGDDIKAKYNDGVLSVEISKKDEAKEKPTKFIDVK